MPLGEAIKQDFRILGAVVAETPGIPTLELPAECCFCLKVIAQTAGTDPRLNDKSSAIFFLDPDAYSGAVLKLEKYVNGAWAEVATLNNDTYGKFQALAFPPNAVDEKVIGYLIDWRIVLNAGGSFGEGKYRVKCTKTPLFGSPVTEYWKHEWYLWAYTVYRVQETVRVEFWQNGKKGDPKDDRRKLDFGTLNWYSQIRLPNSRFGYDTGEYTDNYVGYQNGYEQWLSNKQVGQYTLKVGACPNCMHRYLRLELLMGENIRITDYTAENPTEHVNKEVKRKTNYDPRWNNGTKMAAVELKFEDLYQNHENKRQ